MLIFHGNICDISILLYDKIDRLRRQIKTRKLLEGDRHHMMAKKCHSTKTTDYLRCVCNKKHRLTLCEQKPDREEKRNRKFVLMSGGLYHLTFRNS